MKRGSNDAEWRKVKQRVEQRDQGKDRMLEVGSIKDIYHLRRLAPSILLQKIDPAHIVAVSRNPDIMYNENNIVSLNRYSHDHLDNYRHPVTGDPITREQHRMWWIKLARDQWSEIEPYFPPV